MRYRSVISLFVVFALLGMTEPVRAGSESGGQTGTLYRFGSGAHVLGFGGAVVSLAHDPVSVLFNPSGAALGGKGKFAASHTRLPMDRSINVIGFGRQIDQRAGFAVTWVNAGVDGLVRYDASGNADGSLSNSENAVAFSFGAQVGPQVLAGVTAKWYQMSLDARTSANWMLSAGMTFSPMPNVRVGLTARDVGGDIGWFTERPQGQLEIDDPFPRTIALGVSYTAPSLGVTGAVNYENVNMDGAYLHLGVSWLVVERLRLRAGYRWIELGEGSREPALTSGATFWLPFGESTIGIDYSAMQDVFGLAHTIGLRFDV